MARLFLTKVDPPKTRRTMSDVERAWVAGLLEGEGCFHTSTHKGRSYPRVRCVMTDLDVIQRLHELTGVGRVYGPQSRGEHKPQWSWQVHISTDALALMSELRPLMGERRGEKIDELLSQFAGCTPQRGTKGQPCLA